MNISKGATTASPLPLNHSPLTLPPFQPINGTKNSTSRNSTSDISNIPSPQPRINDKTIPHPPRIARQRLSPPPAPPDFDSDSSPPSPHMQFTAEDFDDLPIKFALPDPFITAQHIPGFQDATFCDASCGVGLGIIAGVVMTGIIVVGVWRWRMGREGERKAEMQMAWEGSEIGKPNGLRRRSTWARETEGVI